MNEQGMFRVITDFPQNQSKNRHYRIEANTAYHIALESALQYWQIFWQGINKLLTVATGTIQNMSSHS